MQVTTRASAELFIVIVFAVLALGGLLWTSLASPTGDAEWAPGIPIPPHRQAYACECTTPKDIGTCAVASCLSADVAHANCLYVLPPRTECGPCKAKGSMQHATSNVHVIATLTCAV